MYRRITIQTIAFLLVLGLLLQQPLIMLFCLLVLLAGTLAWLWNRWSLTRVMYSCELSTERAFPDDEIELRIRVANHKILPLAALYVRELIPPGLRVTNAPLDRDFHGRQVLQRIAGLHWYEALTWRYQLACETRGAYYLGPAQLETGDPFGFLRSIRDEPRHTRLLVYPRLLSLEELRLPPRKPIGEIRARQLIRDPLRTVGVRDYRSDDPMKDIHWAATARVGSLQTRVYESTASRTVALFLDLDTFERYWEGIDPDQVERLISAAATLVRAALDEGYAVGLYANGAPAEQEQLARLPPSRNPGQLQLAMDMLASLTGMSITPMTRLLHIEADRLAWGSTLILLSAIKPESMQILLGRQRQQGRSVVWLYLGQDAAPKLADVQVIHVPPQGDWRRPPLVGTWKKG